MSRSTAAGAGVFVVVRRRTLHGANCAIAMRSAVVFNFRVHITINVCRQRSRSWRRSASSPYQPHRTAGTGLECRTRPIPIRLHHSVGIFAMSIADDAEQSHCTQRRMALRARSGRFGPACVSMRSSNQSTRSRTPPRGAARLHCRSPAGVPFDRKSHEPAGMSRIQCAGCFRRRTQWCLIVAMRIREAPLVGPRRGPARQRSTARQPVLPLRRPAVRAVLLAWRRPPDKLHSLLQSHAAHPAFALLRSRSVVRSRRRP